MTTFADVPDSGCVDMIQNYRSPRIERGIMDSRLYCYRDGMWVPDGKVELQRRMVAMGGNRGFTASKLRNIRYLFEGIEPTMPAVAPGDSKYLVNVLNGAVDIQAHPDPALLAHDPEHKFRYIVPHEYGPTASCPAIDSALATMFPDPDMVALLHEVFGYCLLPGFSLKKAILFHSRAPSTGKSTILNLLGALVGHANEATVSLQDLDDHKFARATLQDKLINRSGDLGAYAPKTSSNFKALVGGDPVLVENKGQNQYSMVNTAKLLFGGNSFAGTHESGAAYVTRWLVIPFTVEFPPNPDFLRALTTPEELRGLLRHAINGAARLVSNNAFTRPYAVEEAEHQLQIETDSVSRYVEECLVAEPGNRLDGPNTYEDYKRWGNAAGLRPAGAPKFYNSIKDMPGAEVIQERTKVIVGLRVLFPSLDETSIVNRWKQGRS